MAVSRGAKKKRSLSESLTGRSAGKRKEKGKPITSHFQVILTRKVLVFLDP
jgi:hypothetical protein